MKYVIIGIGAAGMTAAKTLRELAPEDEIVMISVDEKATFKMYAPQISEP